MSLAVDDRFARSLREHRGRRRLSQLELALRSGTSQRYVSFVERALSVPGRSMVVRLTEALELRCASATTCC